MNNTVNSIKKATVLNAFAKYSTVIMQLVYTAILSRILTPDEYGIVAIINVFIIFFQAEDGIRDPLWSRGLGDVYKRQHMKWNILCHIERDRIMNLTIRCRMKIASAVIRHTLSWLDRLIIYMFAEDWVISSITIWIRHSRGHLVLAI